MKNYKQFIIGFLIGSIMFSVVPINATIEEYILYKINYKIMINGKEYISENLPILNYKGNTYAPLRPMLEAAGFDVKWNAEFKQIEATLNETKVNDIISNIKETYEPYRYIIHEGKIYYEYTDLAGYFRELYTGYILTFDSKKEKVFLVKFGNNETNKTEIELQHITINGQQYIEKEYYYNTVLPIVKGAK